jgi:Ca-activated chloride channel family protein
MNFNRNKNQLSFALVGLLLTLVLSAFIQAQEVQKRERIVTPKPTPTPTPEQVIDNSDEVIQVNSRLVVVPVSVVDKAGQPVMNLKAENFRLEEEGQAQEISQISPAENIPLEIALLVDVSGSTNTLFKFEQETAARFLRNVMRPEDRATIFLIGEKPVLAQPRDTAEKTAENVRAIVSAKKFTAFYDTVMAAANYLKANAPAKSRKVILVLSDGEDNYSKLTRNSEIAAYQAISAEIENQKDQKYSDQRRREIILAKRDEARKKAQGQVLKQLQNADTVFYAVNPVGSSYQLNKISLAGQGAMERFAGETGGTAFLPKKVEDLESIFQRITAELRAQYLVQYYSESNSADGSYVRLRVTLTNNLPHTVRARQGYFVTLQNNNGQ